MNLKELTWENHKSAERKKFAKTLMSGSIDPALYYKYLTNQFYSYVALEYKLPLSLLGLEDIRRANLMRDDLQELEQTYGFVFDGNLPLNPHKNTSLTVKNCMRIIQLVLLHTCMFVTLETCMAVL